MKKTLVRCYQTYEHVYSATYNYPVYHIVNGGWANRSFCTCIQCAELFVLNWENPANAVLSITDIAGEKFCPTCNAKLSLTLKSYPQNIRLGDGKIGNTDPNRTGTPENESFILDFYELEP